MFNCFKTKVEDVKDNVYPALVYSVYWNTPSGSFNSYKGVFELEEDAKQYCINNTDQAYFYVVQYLIPPTYDPWAWPTYTYPAFYTDNVKNIRYTFYQCFVTATDASDFMTEHSNASTTFGYGNCYYYPAGSLSLMNNKSNLFKSIAPHEIIIPEDLPGIQNK